MRICQKSYNESKLGQQQSQKPKQFKFKSSIQSKRYQNQQNPTNPIKSSKMQPQMKLTSIKKRPQDNRWFTSPKSVLEEQISDLQLLNQQQMIARLKQKKADIMKQSEQVIIGCHEYFRELTAGLAQAQGRIRRQIDSQTLDILEQVQKRIQQTTQNDHSFNSYSSTYHNLKLLNFSFSTCHQPTTQLCNFLSKCFTIQTSALSNQQSHINDSGMCSDMRSQLKGNTMKSQVNVGNSTMERIVVYESEFMTSNKKPHHHHGHPLPITEQQFSLALEKFHQRQEKQLLINERLKTKIKSLQETLSKKGLNIKQLNRLTSDKNDKCSVEYWDLELDRVKGENQILREEMTQVSNKLMEMVTENEGLKGECRRMVQSNVSIGENHSMCQQTNTVIQGITLQEHSRIITPNNPRYFNSSNLTNNNSNDHRQSYVEQQRNNTITSQTMMGEEGVSGIYLHSNINETGQSELERRLGEAEKKVQQLTLQLTKRLTQLQTLTVQQQSSHNTMTSLQLTNNQLSQQLKDLAMHNESLEHDYEVSCKKKFELQEKVAGLKVALEQEREMNESGRLAVDSLQAMVKLKEEEVQRLKGECEGKMQEIRINEEKKNAEINQVKKQLGLVRNRQLQLNTKIESLTKQLKQSQLKSSALKQQLKRQHQVITSKQQQISKLTQTLYQSQPSPIKQLPTSSQQKSLPNPKQTSTPNLKQTPKQTLKPTSSQQQILKDQDMLSKYESTRKQLTKAKKQLKQLKQSNRDLARQVENLKGQFNKSQQLLSYKLPQVNVKIEMVLKEVERSKTMYLSAIKVNQGKLALMKEKVEAQLGQLLFNNTGTQGKKNNLMEQVGKYVEELKGYAAKKAEIKKLKEENAQLKAKQTMPTYPKYNINNIQLHSQQLNAIQKSLLQDRLLTEKQMLQDRLNISQEQTNMIKTKLSQLQQLYVQEQEQSAKLGRQLTKLQSTTASDQMELQLKQAQQKVEKMQAEVKSLKSMNKKLSEEMGVVQQQLKKKKEHIANMKVQLTSSEDKIQELNLMVQAKSEEIERQKRLLKDQATKEMLLGQMKEKVEDLNKLQQANQDLKKQLQKIGSAHKFQLGKVQAQLTQLKIAKAQELELKVTQRTASLIQQLNDLKTKNKKLKSELQRKESLGVHLKSKQSSELNQVQQQLADTQKELSRRTKDLESQEKKNELLNVSFKKFKQKAKLLSIALEKVYTKILNSHKHNNYKQPSTVDNPSLLQNTLLQNTSPISRFANSPHKSDHNPALSTLAQLDINFEDLDKYSEGLEMFGLNASELKQFTDMKTETFVSTQNCFSSPVITKNVQNLFQTKKIEPLSPSKTHNFVNSNSPNDKVSKGNLTELTKCLSENEQVDLNQIMTIFDQALHAVSN